AFRARGKQSDRTTHQFFDPPDIFDRLRRQVRPGAGLCGRLLPAFDGLVDRDHPGLCAFAGRQVIDLLAVELVTGADLNAVEAVENVEFGEREPVDAAGPHGLAHQRSIEPAATPLAPGIDAELAAAAPYLVTDLVQELGRKGPLADAGRIG